MLPNDILHTDKKIPIWHVISFAMHKFGVCALAFQIYIFFFTLAVWECRILIVAHPGRKICHVPLWLRAGNPGPAIPGQVGSPRERAAGAENCQKC